MRPERTTLNVGCGRKQLLEAVNADRVFETRPDVVVDFDSVPWPFDDNTFSVVRCFDIMEHLADVVTAMEEIHRVSKPGATVQIAVPHFSSANSFTDPTHRRGFGILSFNYFTGEHEFSYYTSKRFRRKRSVIVFYQTLFSKVVRRLANRWPESYERRWAWMFPAWYLYFELEVIKDSGGR